MSLHDVVGREWAMHDSIGILRNFDIPLPIPIPASLKGWMFTEELVWLYGAALGLKERGVPGEILEIGSYQGLSTVALAQAGKVTCVDTWLGGLDNMPAHDSFSAFWANISSMGLTEQIEIVRGDSREVLPLMRSVGEKYRMILVDGDHSYETAKADLVNAWELLSPGGILVADDMFTDDVPTAEKVGYRFVGVTRACVELGGFKLLGPGKLGFKIKETA